MTAKEGPGSGKHIRALALAAVFAAGCLGFGRPVTALAEEVTVIGPGALIQEIGPGALIQEEEDQTAAEEAQQQEALSQGAVRLAAALELLPYLVKDLLGHVDRHQVDGHHAGGVADDVIAVVGVGLFFARKDTEKRERKDR